MIKNSTYYTEGIRRKLFSILFQKKIVRNRAQTSLIKKLVSEIKYPVQAKFSPHYPALDYLNKKFVDQLIFENEIAIAETGGTPNPLTPAIYALHCYNSDDKDLFRLHAEYILSQVKKSNDQYYWEYSVEVVRFIIPAPWVSGISQGVIASVMLRMYYETKEEKYLEIAKGAIAYCLDNKNNLKTDQVDGFWIEEYPSEIGKGVLNGFLFFIIAVAELSSFGFFKEEFEEGLKGLLTRIPFYHKGIYLKYGAHIPDLCNHWYDKIHYHQLDAMYTLTKENVFLKLKKYWANTSSTNFKT